jgi:serine/threonine protein kinase
MDHEDIAGYSLRRKLGSGSAGAVWQVRDLASGRNAVLKRIPITAIIDEEKLREDLSILQRIRHPHVARLLDLRETGTEWLLVSQYVVAGSLSALLARRGPFSAGELVTLLVPLAEALDHLHRSGLTHGSVMAANTLFDADGRPVLTDTALRIRRPTDVDDCPQAWREVDDLLALATLSHQAGGDPAVFTPELFTTTPAKDLPRRLLAIASPAPIDLAFPQDQTGPITPDTIPSPPRPRATTKPSTTDDPIECSRSPLSPPPDEPSSRHISEATNPDPLPPSKPLPKPTRQRRPLRRPKLARRTPSAPLINPLSRLAPPTSVPAPAPVAAPALGSTPVPALGSVVMTPRPDRPRTRLPPWRRRHTVWGRLLRRDGTPSPPAKRRIHPAYGVLAAVAAGAVIVLVIGIATIGALDSPTNQAAASDQQTTPTQPATTTSTPAPSQPTPQPTPVSTDATWARTLQSLDAQRAQAFWTLDLETLDKIYVPGSIPWHADRALLSAYRQQQVRVQGLRIKIERTSVTHRTPTTVTLKTTDHLTAGQAVDQTGTTTPFPPGVPTTRLITLTTTATTRTATPTWRISTITPA